MENVPETISASRVPAVLGLDKRLSPLALFLQLRGVVEPKDISNQEAIREGIYYERATAEIACAKFGMKIVEGFEQKTLRHGKLSGHPDFLMIDEHGKLVIGEVKNPFFAYSGGEGDDDWGEPGTDEVPRAYYLQSLIYSFLFQKWIAEQMPKKKSERETTPEMEQAQGVADYAYVIARLRGGVERFKVPYSYAVVQKVESEVDMMLERVRLNDPPTPADEQDMRLRWVVDEEKPAAECNIALVSVLDHLQKVKASIKVLEKQESELKMQVLGHMQDCGELQYVDHGTGDRISVATAKASRSFQKSECWEQHRDLLLEKGYVTVDTTRLRAEQKGLYDQFMKAPTNVAEQKRTIRLKSKAIDQILQAQEAQA